MGRGVFWLGHKASLSGGRKRDARGNPPPAQAALATPADLKMMQRALKLARRASTKGEVPVGAVVYRTADGQVLAECGNTRECAQNPSGHAEFSAMLAAAKALGSWRLDGCTLVVTLEPCAMCAGLIVNARVGRVVFGAMDPKAGFVGSLGNLLMDERLNHRVQAIAGVCGEECGALLSTFFADLRKRKKQGTAKARTAGA